MSLSVSERKLERRAKRWAAISQDQISGHTVNIDILFCPAFFSAGTSSFFSGLGGSHFSPCLNAAALVILGPAPSTIFGAGLALKVVEDDGLVIGLRWVLDCFLCRARRIGSDLISADVRLSVSSRCSMIWSSSSDGGTRGEY